MYPSGASAAWTSYRAHVAGPLADDEALTSLARFPEPAALRRLLREGTPVPLHDPAFDAMFVGRPSRIWDWPGVREMGAVLLLDPWPLSPLKASVHDALIVDARAPVPPERTIYVPDPECAALAEGCETFAEARARMPADWRRRLDAALARIDAHIAKALAAAAAPPATDDTGAR